MNYNFIQQNYSGNCMFCHASKFEENIPMKYENIGYRMVKKWIQVGAKDIFQLQTCQVSRIWRETHAFDCHVTLTRISVPDLTPFPDSHSLSHLL